MSLQDSGRGALAGKRILVAEDDALIALGLQDLLVAHGAVISGAVATVPQALAALGRALPDGLLLDVNLRGVWSTPVAQAARRVGVPFVLVTGYSRRQLDDPVLAAAPIVPKPVDYVSLVRVLAQALTAAPQ
jgi:CheY-like chemotaxis protein